MTESDRKKAAKAFAEYVDERLDEYLNVLQ